MLKHVSCPQCEQGLLLPPTELLIVAVRCPLCEALVAIETIAEGDAEASLTASRTALSLHEAAAAIDAAVAGVDIDGGNPWVDAAVAADVPADTQPTETAGEADVCQPGAANVSGDEPVAGEETGVFLTPAMIAEEPGLDAGVPADVPSGRESVSAEQSDGFTVCTEEEHAPGDEATDFPHMPPQLELDPNWMRSSRQRPSHLLGHVIGVVGGGVLGLVIGYYLLNWIGGPRYNFLDLRWPGLSVPAGDRVYTPGDG